MSMTTTAPLTSSSALFMRWCAALPPACQAFPEEILSLYWERAHAGSLPMVDDFVELGCSRAEAEAWQRASTTKLIHPSYYETLFHEEDALEDLRIQRTNLHEKVEANEEAIASLTKKIVAKTGVACLSEADEQAERPLIDELEEQRLLCYYRREDFPLVERDLETQQTAQDARLKAAQTAIADAYAAHMQARQAAILAQAELLLEPVLTFLKEEGTPLDEGWTMLGHDLAQRGSPVIRDELLRRVRAVR